MSNLRAASMHRYLCAVAAAARRTSDTSTAMPVRANQTNEQASAARAKRQRPTTAERVARTLARVDR
jgi:hypothetical protein